MKKNAHILQILNIKKTCIVIRLVTEGTPRQLRNALNHLEMGGIEMTPYIIQTYKPDHMTNKQIAQEVAKLIPGAIIHVWDAPKYIACARSPNLKSND